MAYDKTNWDDGVTPINAENLNKIETGVEGVEGRLTTEEGKTALVEGKVVTVESKVLSIETGVTKVPKATNSDTVGGLTVKTAVPTGAKFTDTVYNHPSTHPASMISGLPTSLPANGGDAHSVDGLHAVDFLRHYTAGGDKYMYVGGTSNYSTRVMGTRMQTSSGAWRYGGYFGYDLYFDNSIHKWKSLNSIGRKWVVEMGYHVNGFALQTYQPTPTGDLVDEDLETIFTAGINGLRYRNEVVWHSGNDGAGSGLDADLLDGQQASYFYSPSNVTISTANPSTLQANSIHMVY